MKYCSLAIAIGCAGAWSSPLLASDPFDTCPTKAFLIQGTTATAYGINIVSGNAEVLSEDMATSGKINAAGFSVYDNYLYGFGYEARDMVRMGKDFQVEAMNVSGLPDTTFYVGDAAVTENAYYFYRKGANFGLYRVSLDVNDDRYLQANRIVDGATLNLSIFDFAFHPTTGEAYAVDSNGRIFLINVNTGDATNLGDLGVSGTFGAAYFDVEGNLYISRNSDGYIYRIKVDDIDNTDLTAAVKLFAIGPESGNNDGARCAIAPLIDDSIEIDFGDAPESYGTLLDDNGPRHEIGSLYLGNKVTNEYVPNSADSGDDGVAFVSTVQSASAAQLQSIVSVETSQNGYLHAWVDWNQNGFFDDEEKVFDAKYLNEGQNALMMNVPAGALHGETWARFRVSELDTLSPTGGVTNGEVEDYQITVTDSQYTTVCYPSSSGFVTLAYEDIWPSLGDYDFNDVVVEYRACQDKINNTVMRYWISGNLVAVGAQYHNAFAVRLSGVSPDNVNQTLISHTIGGEKIHDSPIEVNRSEVILQVLPDTSTLYQSTASCSFFRTEEGCAASAKIPFELYVPLSVGKSDALAPRGILDPFIFAVEGFWHGPHVTNGNARGWEVHLKNQAPTSAFDTGLLGTEDDASSPSQSLYFATDRGLPFAIQISEQWSPPLEAIDITDAYPLFADFAESNGEENSYWFTVPATNKVILENEE